MFLSGATIHASSASADETVFGSRTLTDATNDVVFCDTTTPVPIEIVHLDLQSVEPVTVEVDGSTGLWDVEIAVRGVDNLGREVSAVRDLDPLIAVRLLAGGEESNWIELRAGYRDGVLLRAVVDVAGTEIPRATLLVDEGADGAALFVATGLPLGTDPLWGVFTRYVAGAQFACDKLDESLSDAGLPLLPLGEVPPEADLPTTVPTVTASTAPLVTSSSVPTPTTSAPAPSTPASAGAGESRADAENGMPWWLIALVAVGLVAFAAGLPLRRFVFKMFPVSKFGSDRNYPPATGQVLIDRPSSTETNPCDALQRECDRLRDAVAKANLALVLAKVELESITAMVVLMESAEAGHPGSATSSLTMARRRRDLAAQAVGRAATDADRLAAEAGAACDAAERCRDEARRAAEDFGA